MATIGARSTGGTGGFPRGLAIGGIVVVIVVMIIAVVAALAALNRGSSSTTDTPSAQAPAVANTGQQTAANSGQTSGGNFVRPANSVRIGEFLVAVTSVKTPSDIRPPQAHLKYVVIELTVQNVGSRANDVGSDSEFSLFDSEGQRAGDIGGSEARARLGELGKRIGQQYLDSHSVNPGQTSSRILMFTILKDTEPARLEFSNRDTRASGTIKLQ